MRRRWLRAIGWIAGALLAIVVATIGVLDTAPGHRLIADRVAGLRPSSGLRIRTRADRRIAVASRRCCATCASTICAGNSSRRPKWRLDWHPLRWVHNRLDVDRLSAGLVTLDRLPKLRSRPGAPILPGFDIRIGRLDIARLRLGKEVGGTAAEMRVAMPPRSAVVAR